MTMIEDLILLFGGLAILSGIAAIAAFVADRLQEWEDGR